MSAMNRCRRLAGMSLVVIMLCVAFLATFVARGVAPTPTVKGSAHAHLTKSMSDYDGAGPLDHAAE